MFLVGRVIRGLARLLFFASSVDDAHVAARGGSWGGGWGGYSPSLLLANKDDVLLWMTANKDDVFGG